MHEIECFETQKKYSQLIFEDLMMILLNFLMVTKILNTPKLGENIKGSSVALSFATTLASIFNAGGMLCLESYGLGENFIEYLMRSMQGKLDWIPYSRNIR